MTGPPLQFLLLLFAGWVNRRQLDVIDYLKAENRILERTDLGGELERARVWEVERGGRRRASPASVSSRQHLRQLSPPSVERMRITRSAFRFSSLARQRVVARAVVHAHGAAALIVRHACGH